MTKFKKGISGNPEGRPIGATGKKNKQWDDLSKKFTGDYSDKVLIYLDGLWKTDKEAFFEAYKSLLNYFKPKLSTSKLDIEATLEAKGSPSWFGISMDVDPDPDRE